MTATQRFTDLAGTTVSRFPFEGSKQVFRPVANGYTLRERDVDVLRRAVGDAMDTLRLGAFLRTRCNVTSETGLHRLTWPQIIAALELALEEGDDREEQSASDSKPDSSGFRFADGHVLYGDIELDLPKGLPCDVFKRLWEHRGRTVPYSALVQDSNPDQASQSLRTAKAAICAALRKHHIPWEIKTIRGQAYLFRQKKPPTRRRTKLAPRIPGALY